MKGFDLRKTIIVDNIVGSYQAQISNGIPIIPYEEVNFKDRELADLLKYLKILARRSNIRKCNKTYFSLEEIQKLDSWE